MDIKETLKIMAVLKVAYPRYYISITEAEAKQAATLWQSMLADYPYEIVDKAVRALIATSTFPPSVAEVIGRIQAMFTPAEMDENQAWALVQRALSNSGYNYEQEFAKLPELCQKAVGSPRVLHQWAMLEQETSLSIICSDFKRAYRNLLSRANEYAALPSDVRNYLPSPETARQLKQLVGGVQCT